MKKILLVHGILHTTEIFDSLEKALGKSCRCVRFYIPGLDDSRKVTVNDNINLLRMHLREGKYDLIVAHSYGAFLVLNSLRECKGTKVLLLNPLVDNLSYDLRRNLRLLKFLPLAKKLMRFKAGRKFLLKYAGLTCNDINKVDDKLLKGLSVCHGDIVTPIKEASRPIRITDISEVYMLWGSQDRILSYPYTLQSFCVEVISIACGHSSFIEREDIVVNKIKELIGGYKNDTT